MGKPRTIAAAAALLLAVALGLRLCRPAPVVPARPVEIPTLRAPAPKAPEPRRAVAPAPPRPPDPARLQPFLERLGRARLLRDRRTIELLRKEMPPLYESDFDWLFSRLAGDLFSAAGAAEIARLFALGAAVPHLASALARPSHPFLKDVLIDTLAAMGGDAAEAALLVALGGDPDEGVRVRCAAALVRFDGPEAYRALIAALRDPSLPVRSAASSALARMKSRVAVELLLAALAEERDPEAQADLVVSAYAAGGEAWRGPIVRAIEERPAAAEILRARVRIRGDARYRRAYDRSFFELGAPAVPFDASKRRIGITLELGSGVEPREIGAALFGTAPLDRYRAWFYFRKADDFPATRAWDSHGSPMGDVPYGDLEATVFLHFKDPSSFEKGVLGFTSGCHAFVQGASLLHEFGHAFARLGDEYEDGSRDDAANLWRKPEVPWMPLVGSGLLANPLLRDAEFFVPSNDCFLGNSPTQGRFCPVCQLEIHARLAELAGAPLPW